MATKRAALFELLQRRLTVNQVIEQKLFDSENEILDAIVKLVDEAKRYHYTHKIEPQLTRRPPEPVITHRSATDTKPVNSVSAFYKESNQPLSAPSREMSSQTQPTPAPRSTDQAPNHWQAATDTESTPDPSFSDDARTLSDFQTFVVEKMRERKLTLQTALDAEIFVFAGMDEFTLAEQGAMISDNAGNYIGATKLSEEMNMIHTQGRGDHIADGSIANDIQSEHNQENTRRFLETRKEHYQLEENQDEWNKMQANKKLARNKHGNTKATLRDEQQAQTFIDTVDYRPAAPRHTR